MKKMRQRRCSGQATTEMAIMLLGFAVLMIGLIFTFSMGIFNTRVLLNAKYNADCAANGAGAADAAGAGREIGRWQYQNDIPFTLKDEAVTRAGDEMETAHTLMDSAEHSDAQDYSYEWMKPSGFPQGNFTHDFKERHNSAIAAARLIVARGEEESSLPLVARLPELFQAAAKLLHVRFSKDTLLNNESNRVYMPANGGL